MGHSRQRHSGEASGKVVVLDRFRSGRSLSPLRQAEAYWLALGGEGQVPRRDQIDPRALENILAHSFILERVTRRGARFRLAGDHLTDLSGMDLRGAPFTALFADDARAEAGAILQRVFTAPAVAELRLQTPKVPGAPVLEGRMLLLPLASEDGGIARALGVLVSDGGGAVPPPVRFDIGNRLLRPVAARTAQDSEAQPATPAVERASSAVDGFAEPLPDWLGPPKHLRLVK